MGFLRSDERRMKVEEWEKVRLRNGCAKLLVGVMNSGL